MRNEPSYTLKTVCLTIFLLFFLSISKTKAQCSTGCTYTSVSGNLTVASGEKLCLDATSGDITVSNDVSLREGSTLVMCSSPTTAVIFSGEIKFNSVATQRTIRNYGNFDYRGGVIRPKFTDIENFGNMFSIGQFQLNEGASLLNAPGALFETGGDFNVTGNGSSLINNGEVIVTGDFTAGSNSSSFDNTGTITATDQVTLSSTISQVSGAITAGGKLTLNSGSGINLTNTVFIADELEFNGGNFTIDPTGCASFLIANDIDIKSTINVVGGGEIDITDSTEATASDNNLCSTCPGLNFVANNACATILPVDILIFYAKKEENAIELNWKTASETENDHFEIERSTDGKRFQLIGVVDGNGTTHEVTSYRFTDYENLEGLSYYRLKQYDYDGDWEYSPVIAFNSAVSSSSNLNLRSFGDVLQADWSTKHDFISYSLYDSFGNELERNLSNKNDIISISKLKKGIHLFKADFGDFSEVHKFFKD